MLEQFLPVIFAALVGVMLKPVMDGLLKVWTWLQTQNAWTIRAALLVVSFVAAMLSKFLGFPIPDDMFHMDGTMVSTVLMALFGHLTHVLLHKPEPTA
jgi:hypothetical protein